MIPALPTQSALPTDPPSIPIRRPTGKDRPGDKDDASSVGHVLEAALALPFAIVLQALQQAEANVGTPEAGKESPPADGGRGGDAVPPVTGSQSSGPVVPVTRLNARPADLPVEAPRQTSRGGPRPDVPRPGSEVTEPDRGEPHPPGDRSTEPAASGAETGRALAPRVASHETPGAWPAATVHSADPSVARLHPPAPGQADSASVPGPARVLATESGRGTGQPGLAVKSVSSTDHHQGSSVLEAATDVSGPTPTPSGLPGRVPGVSIPRPVHGLASKDPDVVGRKAPGQTAQQSTPAGDGPANSAISARDDLDPTPGHGRAADGRGTRGDDGANGGAALAGPPATAGSPPSPSGAPDVSRPVPAQVLQQIAAQPLALGTTVVIRLDPPLLGNVVLRVVAGDGKRIRLHFQVDEPEVGDALASSLGKLESALRAQGLNPEGLSVGLATAQTAGDPSGQPDPRPFAAQASHSSPRSAHLAPDRAPADPPRPVRIGGGRYIDFLL